ncbi:U6 snRNA phosphodiesterase [Trichoplusia ni]|uniref:U6 snRNA phosphodiesterase n=1 Tax=Trichoplusia ni TaxID=7111 RepID=A0A7E5VQC8_TRINI|nr:U6 snRNA phosphodiesterase [Trichoplusia ni]
MSALSYLCEYESNSDDSDSDLNSPKRLKRSKLPVPNLSKVAVVPSDSHEDNAVLHEGRKRSFPHVRGNWATFVYVNYHVDTLFDLIAKLQEVVAANIGQCHHCEDFHISLSRTFVLKYHLISPFSTSLQKTVSGIDSFHLGFAAVKIYCNEENSRTFISLDVDPLTQRHLLNLTKKVDGVLNEFQLPTFYETPSFHMSVLWVNGNKKLELESILEELNELFYENIEKSPKTFLVDTVNCKSGNKYFQYSLS